MRKFVDIESCFSSNATRDIASLAELYQDRSYLKSLIAGILFRNIDRSVFSKKVILLKPNWVKHSEVETDDLCLRTNDNFLLSLLEVVLECKPMSVLIGDAPIQGCKWDKVVTEEFKTEFDILAQKYKSTITIKDFRRRTFNPDKNTLIQDRRPLSEYVIFDLGRNSFLEPISDNSKNLFRVTDYNPDRLVDSHGPGVHKYCITKELFEADIVISVPKVKSHQKTGITAALKNLVGVNGDKDYLPHHRRGSLKTGGDCYPDQNVFRTWAELTLDFANRNQGKKIYWFARKLTSVLWRLSLPRAVHDLGAAWYGNDTAWRMVLDLNKIALYGKIDGTLSSNVQRQVFSLCDGIIGGQGNGPLKPDPLELGLISFSNHSGLNDIAFALLMGFDTSKIAMLNELESTMNFDDVVLSYNGKEVKREELRKFAVKAKASPGWEGYVNLQ